MNVTKTQNGLIICPDRKLDRFIEMRGADIKMMMVLCSASSSHYGTVDISSQLRREIQELFKINKSTVSDTIIRLEELGAMKRCKSIGMINPLYMYKGSEKDYKSRLETYEKMEQIVKIKGEIKTYIMLDAATGYYKIGKSANPSTREKTLQAEKPVVEIVHVFQEDIENVLHKKYKEKRIRGEWFNLSASEVNHIIENGTK